MDADVRYFVVSLPVILTVWYVTLSIFSFLRYAKDKSAARRGRGRTPEAALHLVDTLGGWPGGLIAQRVLRHKTANVAFQVRFAASVLANLALLWLVTRAAS